MDPETRTSIRKELEEISSEIRNIGDSAHECFSEGSGKNFFCLPPTDKQKPAVHAMMFRKANPEVLGYGSLLQTAPEPPEWARRDQQIADRKRKGQFFSSKPLSFFDIYKNSGHGFRDAEKKPRTRRKEKSRRTPTTATHHRRRRKGRRRKRRTGEKIRSVQVRVFCEIRRSVINLFKRPGSALFGGKRPTAAPKSVSLTAEQILGEGLPLRPEDPKSAKKT